MASSLPSDSLILVLPEVCVEKDVCKFTILLSFLQGFPCLTLLFLFCAMCDLGHCRLINSCMEAYAKAPSTL